MLLKKHTCAAESELYLLTCCLSFPLQTFRKWRKTNSKADDAQWRPHVLRSRLTHLGKKEFCSSHGAFMGIISFMWCFAGMRQHCRPPVENEKHRGCFILFKCFFLLIPNNDELIIKSRKAIWKAETKRKKLNAISWMLNWKQIEIEHRNKAKEQCYWFWGIYVHVVCM